MRYIKKRGVTLKTVKEAFAIIEKDHIGVLRECSSIEQRHEKLMELFPEESIFWNPMEARWLVYELHLKHDLDFGVCKFYLFEDDEQYCLAGNEKIACVCAIPQKKCVIRTAYQSEF